MFNQTRGDIIPSFLQRTHDSSVPGFISEQQKVDAQYGPYNVLLGDIHGAGLWHHSNRMITSPYKLSAGLHAMSNGRQADEWPKMRKGKARLHDLLDGVNEAGASTNTAWKLLAACGDPGLHTMYANPRVLCARANQLQFLLSARHCSTQAMFMAIAACTKRAENVSKGLCN